MVTVLLVFPPMLTVSGTAAPVWAVAAIFALIWYRPTEPGASPEKETSAGAPPMFTSGVSTVRMLSNEQISPLFAATVYAAEEAIINALGEMKAKDATARLQEIVKTDSDDTVAAAAGEALKKIGATVPERKRGAALPTLTPGAPGVPPAPAVPPPPPGR